MGIDLDFFRKPPRELVVDLTKLKLIRYSLASVVAVSVSQPALWLFAGAFGWSGVQSNLASVAIGTVPNYLINRYWTWQQRGRNRFWTEIVPFWVMVLLGTILSTLAAAYADDRWGTALAISIAQLSGFGVLWFARFLILDKVMWRVMHDRVAEDDEPNQPADDLAPAADP